MHHSGFDKPDCERGRGKTVDGQNVKIRIYFGIDIKQSKTRQGYT